MAYIRQLESDLRAAHERIRELEFEIQSNRTAQILSSSSFEGFDALLDPSKMGIIVDEEDAL